MGEGDVRRIETAWVGLEPVMGSEGWRLMLPVAPGGNPSCRAWNQAEEFAVSSEGTGEKRKDFK